MGLDLNHHVNGDIEVEVYKLHGAYFSIASSPGLLLSTKILWERDNIFPDWGKARRSQHCVGGDAGNTSLLITLVVQLGYCCLACMTSVTWWVLPSFLSLNFSIIWNIIGMHLMW